MIKIRRKHLRTIIGTVVLPAVVNDQSKVTFELTQILVRAGFQFLLHSAEIHRSTHHAVISTKDNNITITRGAKQFQAGYIVIGTRSKIKRFQSREIATTKSYLGAYSSSTGSMNGQAST